MPKHFFKVIEDNDILNVISRHSANVFLDIYFIMSIFGPHEQDFFKESSKNYYAASLFSLHLVCITHNKFKYKCCCNNSLNLTPGFLLCLMHVERKKGGFGQETQWASSSHTEMQHDTVFLKCYLKRQWPGKKALKPKNILKLVFLSSDIKAN